MAEVTASIGCYVASGYQRLAGVQLSINHVGPAQLGDLVQATAKPIQLGCKIQVTRSVHLVFIIFSTDHESDSCQEFDCSFLFFSSKKLCATAISQLYYIHPSGNINRT
jgi:acyl-coenzyme A thioesterase PaaI-like protein